MPPLPRSAASQPDPLRRVGVIIPACDEEESIASVLAELQAVLPAARYVAAVGVNGSSDRTAEICCRLGVVTGETARRGYGHGCLAAIARLREAGETVDAYVFLAADGANDPRDIPALVEAAERGHDLVLGTRTRRWSNLRVMGVTHGLANRFLGLWASVLSGLYYTDLGPLRLIRRAAFERLQFEHLTFGWTIEPQVAAGPLSLRVQEIPVSERPRRAGRQKVSQVSLAQTWRVGWAILLAGWRTSARWRRAAAPGLPVAAQGASES